MPTGPVATFSNVLEIPLKLAGMGLSAVEDVRLKPSTTFAAGQVIGEIGVTGVYGPYATGNSDGTQIPTHILQYACVTDAASSVFFGNGPAGTSEWGQSSAAAPAYLFGYFNTADIVAPDTGWLIKMGRLVQGTATSGHVLIS